MTKRNERTKLEEKLRPIVSEIFKHNGGMFKARKGIFSVTRICPDCKMDWDDDKIHDPMECNAYLIMTT